MQARRLRRPWPPRASPARPPATRRAARSSARAARSAAGGGRCASSGAAGRSVSRSAPCSGAPMASSAGSAPRGPSASRAAAAAAAAGATDAARRRHDTLRSVPPCSLSAHDPRDYCWLTSCCTAPRLASFFPAPTDSAPALRSMHPMPAALPGLSYFSHLSPPPSTCCKQAPQSGRVTPSPVVSAVECRCRVGGRQGSVCRSVSRVSSRAGQGSKWRRLAHARGELALAGRAPEGAHGGRKRSLPLRCRRRSRRPLPWPRGRSALGAPPS